MALVHRVTEGYQYLFYELSDQRTKDWWLTLSPGTLLTILGTYIYFCVKAGPQYMKDRKPYNLKYVVMSYNIFQITLSLQIVYSAIAFVIIEKYNGTCHSVDVSYTPTALRWADTVWYFCLAKITELLDTVFFVLRKKNNQISFLHLYHHFTMAIIGWLGIKYAAGGSSIPVGAINSFVHIIMYFYYFIASLGPQYQKYLWWKKYLTSMQLIQFIMIMYFNVDGLLATNCNYPKFQNAIVLLNCVAFFIMFGRFYYNSYVRNRKQRSE